MRIPETTLEIRKKATFLKIISKSIIYKFLNGFTTHKKKTSKAIAFSCTLSKLFLNKGTFQQSGKQDSFSHTLKSSANMYEI